jgi:hypothetical protein
VVVLLAVGAFIKLVTSGSPTPLTKPDTCANTLVELWDQGLPYAESYGQPLEKIPGFTFEGNYGSAFTDRSFSGTGIFGLPHWQAKTLKSCQKHLTLCPTKSLTSGSRLKRSELSH